MNKVLIVFLLIFPIFFSCVNKNSELRETKSVYQDVPFLQDYAIKYYSDRGEEQPYTVFCDRNDIIQVLLGDRLYRPFNGHFQVPGTIEPDQTYRPMKDKKIADMISYKEQFVYLDDKAVFSNAWAGKLFIHHQLPEAQILAGGSDFDFMISDGRKIEYLSDGQHTWLDELFGDTIIEIKYDHFKNRFLILTHKNLFSFSINNKNLESVFSGGDLTCFEVTEKHMEIVVGTDRGFYRLSPEGQLRGELLQKLPWIELTTISEIGGQLWFGSTKGAFMLRNDGKFDYYFGERWLPGNTVVDIAAGPENSVLILTDRGLGQICFKKMTLEEKALVYEKQVRQRHIRYGINSNVTRLRDGELSTAQNSVADSDNLWTGMYLASQLFRYKVTGSDEAKQNCYEAFEAMERLHHINSIPGLFGRSFERRGYQEFRKEYRSYVEHYWYDGYQGTISWRHAENPEWDWRASASSDQTVGQIFALTLIAEYIDDESWRERAITLLDQLMTYIVENDMCLVDYNGKPSLWGRWHPEYVNRFDTNVGDRKICSSNIIAFLQTAYRFTNKEMYKEAAFNLMNKHSYLENLMRPFAEIGPSPENADAWSKMLSESWNHSDDEMYFLGYWGLFPYAFNDTLKEKYRLAIKDHWEWERPEKNALWNFCYAMTGAEDFDLEESVWHLKEFPLDMIQFAVQNSHRKDIEYTEPNFWGQNTSEVLPPDERPELKHNRSLFKLDASDRRSELSAGDTFLLPYWMGRFLGVISPPLNP